jgi:hypothetical protein
MFKIPRFNNLNNQLHLNKIFINTNPIQYKEFFSINKFKQNYSKEININNNIDINIINKIKISQFQSKNFFKKIFNKKENKEKEIETIQNTLKINELRLQDKNGNINLSQNTSKANDGEYEFSHKTETQNENEIKENFEETNLLSKDGLEIEDIGFKKTSTSINYLNENNIHKFANLINFEMKFVSNNQIEKYNQLNFEEDLVKLKEDMNKFGFNDKLIHSIFRKK